MKYRMKYRLKDRELRRKLDELSDGDFSRQLASNKKRIFAELNFLKQMILWFRKSEGPFHALMITPDMVEKVREYDPHNWNEYPEVTPPEGVWMRVEWRDGVVKRLAVARYEAWGGGKQFVWVSDKRIIREVDRFRPLDDPEDE